MTKLLHRPETSRYDSVSACGCVRGSERRWQPPRAGLAHTRSVTELRASTSPGLRSRRTGLDTRHGQSIARHPATTPPQGRRRGVCGPSGVRGLVLDAARRGALSSKRSA
eukprot:2602359-Rhodomonas_salina.1